MGMQSIQRTVIRILSQGMLLKLKGEEKLPIHTPYEVANLWNQSYEYNL